MEPTPEQTPLQQGKKNGENQPSVVQKSLKRKRNNIDDNEENNISFNPLLEVFLKIIYPLSSYMEKSILIGVFKTLDFAPGILIQHGKKTVLFTEDGWSSFNRHVNLAECYHLNKVYGRKTSKRLENCDIEIDNIKLGATQGVRFRDLTKYNSKVILNDEEFEVMLGVIPAINRYLEQLTFTGPVIKDYIFDTTEKNPKFQVIHGPVDSSIYNRLPQEIDFYRKLFVTKQEPVTVDLTEEKSPKKEGEEEEEQKTK